MRPTETLPVTSIKSQVKLHRYVLFRLDRLRQHNFTSYQELLTRTKHNLQCLNEGQLKMMQSTDLEGQLFHNNFTFRQRVYQLCSVVIP